MSNVQIYRNSHQRQGHCWPCLKNRITRSIECNRVLKDDGLLCFSYHHSTIEGWMAIYNSVAEAGFDIVAAHPVKSEMSVASPKSAAKEPINLDAILVCKKELTPPVIKNPNDEVLSRFNNYIKRFEAVGRTLSSGDRFVIACSQAIGLASMLRLNREKAKEFVIDALELCSNKTLHTDGNSAALQCRR